MKSIFNIKQLLFIVLATSLVFSCVPRKKVVYVQEKNEKSIKADNQLYKEMSHYVTEYKIREGDILNIRVYSLNHDEYNFLDRNNAGSTGSGRAGASPITGYVVDDSGYVEIPIVGKIKVTGQTIEEAESTIKIVLEDYVISPTVVLYNMSYNFTILGEVKSSGTFSSTNRRVNILQAIAMAGDLTEFADRSQVKLLRYRSKGQVEVFYLNLLSQDIFKSEAFQVLPNDMIIVAPMASKNFRKNIIPLTGFILSTMSATYVLLIRLKLI